MGKRNQSIAKFSKVSERKKLEAPAKGRRRLSFWKKEILCSVRQELTYHRNVNR